MRRPLYRWTYGEYANVVMFAIRWNTSVQSRLAEIGVPVVPGPDGSKSHFIIDRYRMRAVERYIWSQRVIPPDRPFWHDGC